MDKNFTLDTKTDGTGIKKLKKKFFFFFPHIHIANKHTKFLNPR